MDILDSNVLMESSISGSTLTPNIGRRNLSLSTYQTGQTWMMLSVPRSLRTRSIANGPQHTPQQNNGSDCGVFSCQTLEALARGKDLVNLKEWEFGARNMKFMRELMVYEIATGKLVKRW